MKRPLDTKVQCALDFIPVISCFYLICFPFWVMKKRPQGSEMTAELCFFFLIQNANTIFQQARLVLDGVVVVFPLLEQSRLKPE